MLNTMFQVLAMVSALSGANGCTVDRVEGSVSVLACDNVVTDVDAAYVGPEGTTYGTVDAVNVAHTAMTADIKL